MAVRLNQMFLHEKLNYIAEGATKEDRIARSREIHNIDPSLAHMLKMAVDPVEKITGLPEGVPDTYKPDVHSPEGIAETTIRQELRRILNFLPGRSLSTLKPFKRESLWIQILEGVHHKEAEILNAVKDQTLLEMYPNLRDILPVFDITPPVEEKKRGRPAKSKDA
jgi:hypothetical protein